MKRFAVGLLVTLLLTTPALAGGGRYYGGHHRGHHHGGHGGHGGHGKHGGHGHGHHGYPYFFGGLAAGAVLGALVAPRYVTPYYPYSPPVYYVPGQWVWRDYYGWMWQPEHYRYLQ
jgi:hypothetical protein